jgi:2-polyprenyl-3-methyl-5-hydroxy-6-metoxy-1,4-benzoquinol methylase
MTSEDAAQAYERNAAGFLAARDRSAVGTRVIASWAGTLPRGASIIELGCGGGYPVSQTLIDAGLKLHAIDGSATLCKTFGNRFPTVPLQCARVQDCDFFARQFDAAIAIGLLFLLQEDEQADLIKRLSGVVQPGGRLLITAPLETGCWNDLNTGISCQSLGQRRYEAILADAGFEQIDHFDDIGANNYYNAVRAK